MKAFPEGRRARVILRRLALGAAGLAALELALQLAGALSGRPSGEPPRGRIVLCAGDAWAAGPGGEGLSSRLEALLRARVRDPSVRVVSRLEAGQDTAALAGRLEEDLEEFSPEAAVVLVGGQNSWASVRPEDAGSTARLRAVLGRVRLFRLAKALWPRGEDLPDEARAAAGRGPDGLSGATSEFEAVHDDAQGLERRESYARARARYRRLTELWPTHPAGFLGGAICFMKEGRLDEGIRLLERAVRLPQAPEHIEVYTQLGLACERKGDFEAAARWWEEGLAKFPRSRGLFEALAKGHQARGDVWKALGAADRNSRLRANPRYRLLERLARASGRADMRTLILKGMATDLRRVCAAARRRRVSLVLASYPDPEAGVPAIASEGGARHLDLGKAFKGGRLDARLLELELARSLGEALGARSGDGR